MPRSRKRYRDLVVIGSSAGGAQTLTELVAGLPVELPATLVVAQHTSPAAPALLADILARAGSLSASVAVDGEPMERGHIYVAPPDHHVLVGEGHLIVSHGPRENGHRPAVDPLFRSAARRYGRRVIAAVLSGTLDDGTAGLITVKARGGITIAQDPEDALYSGMPENAIEGDSPDYVVAISELADLLCTLVQEPLEPTVLNGAPWEARPQQATPRPARAASEELRARGARPAAVSCPECNGPLFEHREASLVTFECVVGHRYSPASLDHEQARVLEGALWNAVRGLYERAELLQRLGNQREGTLAERFLERARTVEEQAEAIIAAIQQLGSGSEQPAEQQAAGSFSD
jgi:two-component system, chemotaxis family, protein-glutamate methylesterase/glutaminase